MFVSFFLNKLLCIWSHIALITNEDYSWFIRSITRSGTAIDWYLRAGWHTPRYQMGFQDLHNWRSFVVNILRYHPNQECIWWTIWWWKSVHPMPILSKMFWSAVPFLHSYIRWPPGPCSHGKRQRFHSFCCRARSGLHCSLFCMACMIFSWQEKLYSSPRFFQVINLENCSISGNPDERILSNLSP